MFGYHDSNRCSFDLWSPVTANSHSRYADSVQKGYGPWEDTPYHTAIENRAFSPYCKHQQECDDIVHKILMGQTDFTLDDHFGQSDLKYISAKLKAAGTEAELTLN